MSAVAKVINLNKFRKQKAKAERVKRAAQNRRLHGRTKAERARDELQKQQLDRRVDGARLEPASSQPDPDGDSHDVDTARGASTTRADPFRIQERPPR